MLIILLGLIIFLVPKLLPSKLKKAAPTQDTEQNQENKKTTGLNKASSPEKLAQWVLQAEKTKSNLKEKFSRTDSAPHSEALFGREQLLIDLFKVINKKVSFIELHGKPGAGKTSLAMEVVNKFKFNYQNVLLYVDFSWAGDEELSTKDAMVQIILSIRPTMRIPDSMTQLTKLYNLVMAKHQGVIVFDNATSADRIKKLKLVASASWLIIVTSEKKLGIDEEEAFSVNVEPLAIEPAQELLID